jgi:subtilisin family serine protease
MLQPVTEFEPEDLIVDTRHRRLVEKELYDLQVWPENPAADQVDESPALGLTLLKGLTSLPQRTDPLWSHHHHEISELEARFDTHGTFTSLDVLLLELRARFARHFGGWYPELGKNRHAGTPVAIDGGAEVQLAGCSSGRLCPVANAYSLTLPAQPVSAVTEMSYGSAGTGVTVGILDALPYRHPHLIGHVPESTFLDPSAHGQVFLPWEGHGMFVADLVLHQAPGAMLDMRGVFRGDSGRANAWDVATRIASFADSDIRILNLSLGCRTLDGQAPLVLTRAIQRLGRDILVVAAAGNHGNSDIADQPFWPAALPDVVAVGATEEKGSGFSPNLPWITCTADGTNVTAAFLDSAVSQPTQLPPRVDPREPKGILPPDTERLAHNQLANGPVQFHGYATWSGTSFSAATVSGAVAAALRPDHDARDALDELLNQSDGMVQPFNYTPSQGRPTSP